MTFIIFSRVDPFHEFHDVVGKNVAAGVGLDEVALGKASFSWKFGPMRLLQIAGPIGIDAAGMERQAPSKSKPTMFGRKTMTNRSGLAKISSIMIRLGSNILWT